MIRCYHLLINKRYHIRLTLVFKFVLILQLQILFQWLFETFKFLLLGRWLQNWVDKKILRIVRNALDALRFFLCLWLFFLKGSFGKDFGSLLFLLNKFLKYFIFCTFDSTMLLYFDPDRIENLRSFLNWDTFYELFANYTFIAINQELWNNCLYDFTYSFRLTKLIILILVHLSFNFGTFDGFQKGFILIENRIPVVLQLEIIHERLLVE
jgi:hypothetical protein